MIYPKLNLGGIYQTEFDKRLFRIIGYDEYEVFYDCLWDNNKWIFSGNFTGKSIFFRMARTLFSQKSKFIEVLPLSDKEFKYFRPDLPLRFGRTNKVNWNTINTDDLTFLKNKFSPQKINTNKIIIVPYGPKGALKKGITIENLNKHINQFEIIKQAIKIQESENNQISNGIGFYRLGYEKGLPRYAIGEFIDQANILTK